MSTPLRQNFRDPSRKGFLPLQGQGSRLGPALSSSSTFTSWFVECTVCRGRGHRPERVALSRLGHPSRGPQKPCLEDESSPLEQPPLYYRCIY
jgi:hypothetical protein